MKPFISLGGGSPGESDSCIRFAWERGCIRKARPGCVSPNAHSQITKQAGWLKGGTQAAPSGGGGGDLFFLLRSQASLTLQLPAAAFPGFTFSPPNSTVTLSRDSGKPPQEMGRGNHFPSAEKWGVRAAAVTARGSGAEPRKLCQRCSVLKKLLLSSSHSPER